MRLYTPDGKKCNICGERIRQWRTSHGLTQEELADAVEVTRQTIISLENGRYNACLLYTSPSPRDS